MCALMTNTYAIGSNWQILIKDMGLDLGTVLRRAGLPGDLFARTSRRLPAPDYYALWNALEAEAEEPIALVVARSLTVEAFDPALFAALCSRDLVSAAERIATFKPLVGPMELHVTTNKKLRQVALEHRWPVTLTPPLPLGLTETVFWVALTRLATRETVTPVVVTGPELPAERAPFEAYFGAPLKKGKRWTVVFREEDARLPFLTENEAMWRVFEPTLRRRLSKLESDAAMSERVWSVLLEMLPAGTPTVAAVAKQLAVSTRTLQRRLSGEDTTFQLVLAETRASLSRHYLQNTQLPVAEISYLLGYEDPNSFYRAFHGWTGTTPEVMRSESREQ